MLKIISIRKNVANLKLFRTLGNFGSIKLLVRSNTFDVSASPSDSDLFRTFEKVLMFLLEHQYIKSDLLENRVWKTILGTGMGRTHSGSGAGSAPLPLLLPTVD